MAELSFTPNMKSMDHQRDFLDESSRRAEFALFWEQGTGKTKPLIENAALLAIEDDLGAALVLAPNGVHRNWHVEEIPKWWPEDAPPMRSFAWHTPSAGTNKHKTELAEFLSYPGFKFLCLSYDSIMTDAGKAASWELLRNNKTVYILDESQRVKTPKAKRTKRVIASSVYAPYRRLASGTPMDSPFDIYSQVRFLDPDFWVREFGIGSFTSFKANFGNWVTIPTAGGRSFNKCTSFRNLDQLENALKKIGSRVLKEDVLDLKPKVYKRAFHEMTPTQRRAYEELRSNTLTLLDGGELVTAEIAIVRILRLQQITSGFINPEAGAAPIRFDPNPKAILLREILSDLTRPALIWGRFVEDVNIAAEASRAAGRRPVIWDGSNPQASLDPFHSGEADDFIANLESNAREGLTLNEADTSIYVSNSTKLLNRKQSEDRNHRKGQTRSVQYIDLLAEDSLDSKVLETLRTKGETAGTVLGDGPTNWLREALE